MVLYINSCVRSESRTDRLARTLLEKLGDYKELRLCEMDIKPLDGKSLAHRTELIEKEDYEAEIFNLAREFAQADTIVISAPYWDGSYPALLKLYLENIYITGLVTRYGDDGRAQGLCKADKLYYVTTAGGPYNPAFSYEHIKDLAVNAFGIKDTELIFADKLDIFGNDAEKILAEVIDELHP